MQDEKAENAQDRKRRKAFYLRNGLKETGLFAHVYGTLMMNIQGFWSGFWVKKECGY